MIGAPADSSGKSSTVSDYCFGVTHDSSGWEDESAQCVFQVRMACLDDPIYGVALSPSLLQGCGTAVAG